MSQYGENGYGEGPYGGDELLAPDQSVAVPTFDHVSIGLSRVALQYQNSPKFLAHLTGILNVANQLETAIQSLFSLPDIDAMGGVNLDTIGAIIGESRYLNTAVNLYGTTTTVLEDPEFRIVLRAKIIKNQSRSTPESILSAMAYLFQTSVIGIDDFGNMSITIGIGRALTAVEKILIRQLNILPRPTGVLLDAVVSYIPGGYFGFADQIGALPYEEDGVSNGGQFAEEI